MIYLTFTDAIGGLNAKYEPKGQMLHDLPMQYNANYDNLSYFHIFIGMIQERIRNSKALTII